MGLCQSQKVHTDVSQDNDVNINDTSRVDEEKYSEAGTVSDKDEAKQSVSANIDDSAEGEVVVETKKEDSDSTSTLQSINTGPNTVASPKETEFELFAASKVQEIKKKEGQAEATKEVDDLTQADRDILLKYFRALDTDNTGFISEQQTRDLLAESGFTTTNSVIRSIMEHFDFDPNGDGKIDFEKFLEIKRFCWKTFALNKQRACSVHIAMRNQTKKSKRRSVRLIPSMHFMTKRSKHTVPKLEEFTALTALLEECDGDMSDGDDDDDVDMLDDTEVSSILDITSESPMASLPAKQEELLRELFDLYGEDDKITISDARDLFAHVGFHCSNKCIRRKVGGKISKEHLTFQQFCMLKLQMRKERMVSRKFSHSFNSVPHMKGAASGSSLKSEDRGKLKTTLETIESPVNVRTTPSPATVPSSGEIADDAVDSCFNEYKEDDGTVCTSVIRDCLQSTGLRRSSISKLIEEHGLDENRNVGIGEFRRLTRDASDGLKRLMDSEDMQKYTSRELEVQHTLFKRYDADHNGSIDMGELRGALSEFGWCPSNSKIKSIMSEIGGSNENAIGFSAFLKLRDYVRRHFLDGAMMRAHRPSNFNSKSPQIGSQASFRNVTTAATKCEENSSVLNATTLSSLGNISEDGIEEAEEATESISPLSGAVDSSNRFAPSNRRATGMVANGLTHRNKQNTKAVSSNLANLDESGIIDDVDNDSSSTNVSAPKRSSSGRRATGIVANGETAPSTKNAFVSSLGRLDSVEAVEFEEENDEDKAPTQISRPRRATGMVGNGTTKRSARPYAFKGKLAPLGGDVLEEGEEDEDAEEKEGEEATC